MSEKLTERESEILALVASGLSTAEIAKQLFLSPQTVEFYRKRMRPKLGMKAGDKLVEVARARLAVTP